MAGRFRRFRRYVPLALTSLLFVGCHGRLDGLARERLYDRPFTVFAAGHLRSPAAGSAGERAQALAPLLLQQADPTQPSSPSGPETVYYVESAVEIGDRRHDRITYLWRDAEGLQGLRLTLGDDGFPLIYEVLRDSSGARLIFVSASLERSASAELGAPAPGRRFSIEREVEATPDVVVPAVLEPGPVPLGPFVYLLQGNLDVATLICRCSPSQVEEVLTSEEYVLEPWDERGHAARERPLRGLWPAEPVPHMLRLSMLTASAAVFAERPRCSPRAA